MVAHGLKSAFEYGIFELFNGSCQFPETEAAIVSSPPALHATHAVMALEAGLAALIEAPFAVSVAEGARVVEVSWRTGRPVLVAQNQRYEPCEQALKKLLREGKVGNITHVSYVDRRARSTQDNFLFDVEYAQLIDAGAHHFDSLRSKAAGISQGLSQHPAGL